MSLFLWSKRSDVYHLKDNVVEKCNTDALRDRQESDYIPAKKSPCKHCAVKP